MLYSLLSGRFSDIIITVIAAAVGFAGTFLALAKPPRFLPRDGGKFIVDKDGNRQAINEKSNGKVTGAGLVFVIIFLLCALLFLPFSVETLIYLVLGFFLFTAFEIFFATGAFPTLHAFTGAPSWTIAAA